MSRQLYKYRVFCNTENDYKYVWGQDAPIVCPSNSLHSLNTNSIVVVDSIKEDAISVSNLPLTSFDEVRTSERTKVIELKSIYGLSDLRDLVTVTSGGQVTNVIGNSEYTISTGATGTDSAWLQSAERGRYAAGLQGEAGIAVRLTKPLTGNQTVKIGLFDDMNGLYFKYTSTELYACILRDGIEAAIPRSAWNGDAFNGSGPSKYTLDPYDGIIYQIRFSWYGYGNIEFCLNTANVLNIQNTWVGHTYNPSSQTSVKNPNLPISIKVENNGTPISNDVRVAGRQYSLLGKYNAISRTNAVYRISVNINSNLIPILSIRKKDAFKNCSIKSYMGDIIPNVNCLVQLRVNCTLTGAVFGAPPDTPANETACEVDTSATAYTGGIPIWTGMISGDRGGITESRMNVDYTLPETQILTIICRALTTNGSVNLTLRWSEEW